MKRNLSIQLKAALLLLVFAMNTVVGFACAIGLDMSFNTSHHQDTAIENPVHVHADGNKHDHHSQSGKHHHDKKDDSKKDDCCNDAVIKFQNVDKNLTQNIKAKVDAATFTAIITAAISLNNLKVFKAVHHKYIVRNFHPPPHNIRIAIRSFQI